MSVEYSMSGDTYVCNNSSDIFIYEKGSVYRLDDGRNELIFSEKYLKAVTCTDNYIFYSVTTAEGALYRYSFQTKQSELLMSKKIVDLKANEKDVFVVYEDGQKGTRTDHAEDYYYQVILYENGTDEVKLNDELQPLNWVENKGQFSLYDVCGYQIVTDESLIEKGEGNAQLPQIVYLQKDDFLYSCNPYNTYININGKITKIDRYDKKILEVCSDKNYGGIDASHVAVKGDKCYLIVQFSKGTWKYQYNPGVSFKTSDYLCSLNLRSGECKVLYQTEKEEQIAGFSIEDEWILLLDGEQVIKYNLQQRERTVVMHHLEKDWCDFFFEECEGKIYIFTDNHEGQYSRTFAGIVE